MKLFRWKSDFKPRFPQIIEKFFGKNITHNTGKNEEIATVPSVNISEADKAFEINIAIPGLDKRDIDISVQNNCLIVSSEKQYSKNDRNKNWIRKEYGYAAFQRMFEIPESADPDKVQADLKKGILTVKMAKKPEYNSKTKRISIE